MNENYVGKYSTQPGFCVMKIIFASSLFNFKETILVLEYVGM